MATNEDASLLVIDVPERCGNAPRKAVIRDFTIALAARSIDDVAEQVTSNVEWILNGEQVLHGHDEVTEWIASQPHARGIKIHSVMTHGTECGVDGVITLADRSTVHFSHVMHFTGGAKSAKIKAVRSYLLPASFPAVGVESS